MPVLVTIVAAAWWFIWRPIADSQGWDGQEWSRVDTAFALCGSSKQGSNGRSRGCVIDGDTLMVYAPNARPRRIRLTGFDAPELDGACPAENALALDARQALADWLAAGPFEWTGAQEPPRDQYGRELRSVRRVSGEGSRETLADAMIDAGLAQANNWGAEPVDWCR